MSRAFVGGRSFLSNFYVYPLRYKLDVYLSAEHAYQSEKCSIESERKWVISRPSPWEAKKAGRIVLLKVCWESMKVGVMEEVVRAKFSSPALADRLLETGDEQLIEVNDWHDNFWGVCDGECKRKGAAHPMGHVWGENNLGKILMKVRGELWAKKCVPGAGSG